MKKILAVLFAVMMVAMLVVSCDDSQKAEAKIEYKDLVGTWQQGTDNDYIKITFTADGKATMNEKTAQYAATYDRANMTVTLKDNVLTFTYDFGTFMYKAYFEGEKLVLTQKSESSMGHYHTDQKYTMEMK